jgi:hypothetical protein
MWLGQLRSAYTSSGIACAALIPLRFLSDRTIVEVVQMALFLVAITCSGLYLLLTRGTAGLHRRRAWLVFLSGLAYVALVLVFAVSCTAFMRDLN